MSSLRLRQRQARAEKILEAARSLFLQNGYSKTNMDAIAVEAEVGVATIYIYFENKEGLVSALIRKDVTILHQGVQELLNDLPQDPIESVLLVLNVYEKFEDYISYDLMREFIIQSKSDGSIRDAISWTRQIQIDGVRRVLDHGRSRNTVSPLLDTEMAAGVIIDLLERHISRLTSIGGRATEPEMLDKYIRILFQNWVA